MVKVMNNPTVRILLILGICLMTTFMLLGVTVLHTRGFSSLMTRAHAATSNTATCATTKGTQPALCEQQDPIIQGCVHDAKTIEQHPVFQSNQQTTTLGEVDLRYSSTCKTYWVRTIAFVSAQKVFTAIHAMLLFHNQNKEDIVGTPTFPDPRIPYVAWTDMTTGPLVQYSGSGSFEMVGETQPLTVVLNSGQANSSMHKGNPLPNYE
ncbi:DUF2690 domain-containing protein [Tengunoibacter tsumagoiensis]|uniref:DUF2690 domain-containing protein n=1 Tax=Tengunoibacter tsumagoiensis TaxID=2014871 RepID=A0A402A7E4_9CHLR|nr:DUF2690 domain-containing protein [Tengunoibacter tsumagoiensis]GCE15053.1 hypothetical protein KTT_49120 [Tengunoibacter tsumagoiensis]